MVSRHAFCQLQPAAATGAGGATWCGAGGFVVVRFAVWLCADVWLCAGGAAAGAENAAIAAEGAGVVAGRVAASAAAKTNGRNAAMYNLRELRRRLLRTAMLAFLWGTCRNGRRRVGRCGGGGQWGSREAGSRIRMILPIGMLWGEDRTPDRPARADQGCSLQPHPLRLRR